MHTLPRRTALAIAFSIALGATSASAADLIAAAQPSPDAIDAARGDPARLILRAGVFDPLTQQLDLRPAGQVATDDTDESDDYETSSDDDYERPGNQ